MVNHSKNTRVRQKFYNILVHTSLYDIYYIIKVVQAMESTQCGW